MGAPAWPCLRGHVCPHVAGPSAATAAGRGQSISGACVGAKGMAPSKLGRRVPTPLQTRASQGSGGTMARCGPGEEML